MAREAVSRLGVVELGHAQKRIVLVFAQLLSKKQGRKKKLLQRRQVVQRQNILHLSTKIRCLQWRRSPREGRRDTKLTEISCSTAISK